MQTHELFSYIGQRIPSKGDCAGVFKFPRQHALHAWMDRDFVTLWGKIKNAEMAGDCQVFLPTDKENGYVKFVDMEITEDQVFSREEIVTCLKTIAEHYGDSVYRNLQRYFAERNILREPHPLAGCPVVYAQPGETIVPAAGRVLPDGFVIPPFDFYTIESKLTAEQQAAISAVEASQGYHFDTAFLRERMGVEYLAPYQIEIIVRFSNYNYLMASRRGGKSLLAAYLAIRQTFLPNQTILYVMPNETYFFQPIIYIDRLINNIKREDGTLKLSFSDNIFRNTTTNSVVKMVSAKMIHGIRSFDGDAIVVDEAAFVSDKEATNIMTIIEQKVDIAKLAWLLAITTIDKETPYNWYYRDFIKAELEGGPEVFTKRVSIYANPFYSERARDKLIQRYIDNNDTIGLMTELMADFPPKASLIPPDFFPLSLTNQPLLPIEGADIFTPPELPLEAIVIGYDPARRKSESAVVVIGISKPGARFNAIILGAFTLPKNVTFLFQVQTYMPALIKALEALATKVILSFDQNGIGSPLHELINEKKIVNVPVHYFAGSAPMNLKDGIIYLGKALLMSHFSIAAQRGTLVSCNIPKLKTLLALDLSDEINQKSDIINAIAIACTAIMHIYPNHLTTPGIAIAPSVDLKKEQLMEVLQRMRLAPQAALDANRQLDRLEKFGY